MTHLENTRTDVPPVRGDNASTGVAAGKPSPWPVFWVAAIAVFLVAMDGTMLFAAFSALRAGFAEATPADLSWVLNAYTVVYAAMLLPAGGVGGQAWAQEGVPRRGLAIRGSVRRLRLVRKR